MAFVVDTTDYRGNPWCPVCHSPVKLEGQFCSALCWREFHEIIYEMGEIIEMSYLTLEEQPWYGVDHG